MSMSCVVRKIARAKWPSDEELERENDNDVIIPKLRGDALTACLRTSNDTLSIWCVIDESEIDKAVLALISGGKMGRINRTTIIYFSEKLIEDMGLTCVDTLGDTAILDYRNLHKDIDNLTYGKLCNVSEIVLSCLREKRVKIYSEKNLKKMLNDSISSGLISQNNLSPELQYNIGLKTIYDGVGLEMERLSNGSFALKSI